MKKHQIKRKKAFTLVELIIVITILAILSTIAFVSFQNYTKDARDWNRITTLKNIESWLSLYTIRNNNYPDPDELVEILWTWNILLSKQWIVWNNVSQKIKLNKEAKDPKDKTNYIYSITWNGKKYQLWTYLEENKLITYLPQITKTYATDINNIDYTNRYFYTIWNKVWILLEDETNQAITKETYWTWTLDLTDTTNQIKPFKVYFSNDTQSGSYTSSWTNLITTIVENQKTTQVKQQPKSCETTPHNGTKVFYKEESVPYLWTCSEWVEFRCDNWEWKNEIETKQDYPYVLPCVVWTPNNCEATTINNYSIPQTNHNTKTNPTPTKTDTTFTNWTKILSQNFICNNWNFQLEWSESFEITNCNSWYYNNNWTSCETQWSWDATNGYVFKNTTWTTTYPKSCNDLLVSTIPNFKVTHTNSPYSSWTNKFVDWVYFIKPDTSDAFKVYCDMTTDWGGWTLVLFWNENDINLYDSLTKWKSVNSFNTEYSIFRVSSFKFSDTLINNIRNWWIYRIYGERIWSTPKNYYIKSSCVYNHMNATTCWWLYSSSSFTNLLLNVWNSNRCWIWSRNETPWLIINHSWAPWCITPMTSDWGTLCFDWECSANISKNKWVKISMYVK